MARSETLDLTAATWTQLTNAAVSSITFQNQSDNYLFIASTSDETAPTNLGGAVRYRPNQGEKDVALSELFSGVSGAARVWGYIREGGAVLVSHA
jgi:hypothetical protein